MKLKCSKDDFKVNFNQKKKVETIDQKIERKTSNSLDLYISPGVTKMLKKRWGETRSFVGKEFLFINYCFIVS